MFMYVYTYYVVCVADNLKIIYFNLYFVCIYNINSQINYVHVNYICSVLHQFSIYNIIY